MSVDGPTGQSIRTQEFTVPRDAILRKLDAGFDPMIDAVLELFLHEQTMP